MPDETLLSAARRVVRFYNIDQEHGGLPSIDTQHAVDTLHRMISDLDKKAALEALVKGERNDQQI